MPNALVGRARAAWIVIAAAGLATTASAQKISGPGDGPPHVCRVVVDGGATNDRGEFTSDRDVEHFVRVYGPTPTVKGQIDRAFAGIRLKSLDCRSFRPDDPRGRPLADFAASRRAAAQPAPVTAPRPEDQRWFCAVRHPQGQPWSDAARPVYPPLWIVDVLGATTARHAACRAAAVAEMTRDDGPDCGVAQQAAHCLPVAADPVVDPVRLLPEDLRARAQDPNAAPITGPVRTYRCRYDVPTARVGGRHDRWHLVQGDSLPALQTKARAQGSRNGILRGACMPAETHDALLAAMGERVANEAPPPDRPVYTATPPLPGQVASSDWLRAIEANQQSGPCAERAQACLAACPPVRGVPHEQGIQGLECRNRCETRRAQCAHARAQDLSGWDDEALAAVPGGSAKTTDGGRDSGAAAAVDEAASAVAPAVRGLGERLRRALENATPPGGR